MHLSEELAESTERVQVTTQYGLVRGRRSLNKCAVFLEVPFVLPPERFADPKPLPRGFRYDEDHEYIFESRYAVQPSNDGQARGTPLEDKLGLGSPSENPLFLNIVCPPEFPASPSSAFPGSSPPVNAPNTPTTHNRGLQVRVYIHGGFLQFGSPHGLSSQAQYISALKREIWVNIGYRLSVFGFLANESEHLRVPGNFGFKDQWLGLEWVRENISAFGGDPDSVIVSGLSAGAHSVHQLLHHASRLPAGIKAPFRGAILQSNAIINDPKNPSQLHTQYSSLCQFLNLDPSSPNTFPSLSSPTTTSWQSLVQAAETLIPYGTFRGTTDGEWMGEGAMAHQASPAFADGLKRSGVKWVVVGDLKEEWYLYSIAHPIDEKKGWESVRENLKRYYPDEVVERLVEYYVGDSEVKEGEGEKEKEYYERMFGVMLSEGQVHLPVRLLHRDLVKNDFPILRYQIHWTPEQNRPLGYITHGTDRALWAYREDKLNSPSQKETARRWIERIDEEIERMESGSARLESESLPEDVVVKKVLTLREDQSVGYEMDEKWEEMMKLAEAVLEEVLMGEGESTASRL